MDSIGINHRLKRNHPCEFGPWCSTITEEVQLGLKPTDNFGMWWKSNNFSSLNQKFYSSVWIVNALSIVCSEMLKLSRNNQNITMLGVPLNTLPLEIYIGIFCCWVLLHYNMSFKTNAGGFNGAFWWYGPRSENWENF